MVGIQRLKIAAWIAPAFLLALVAVFVVAPWSMTDKLQSICFGI